MQEEIDRFPTLHGWQLEESKANLYLFACAIACTVDDYFTRQWLNLSALSNRLPRFRPVITFIQALLRLLTSIAASGDRRASRWRRRWDSCVSRACALLICNASSQREQFEQLKTVWSQLGGYRLPDGLLERRMRLPEAYRSQDMSHHDVLLLARRYCASSAATERPTVLMGLRTAGAYFVPLMTEYLKGQNRRRVSWFSIRPKNGVTWREMLQLRRAAKENAQMLVVDDYPATGHTLRLTLEKIQQFGIRPEQIVVIAPTHTAQPNWPQLSGIAGRIPYVTIQPADLHKVALLSSEIVERLCGEYYAARGWERVRVLDDDRVRELNERLAIHSRDGHHVREKRVFSIELSTASGKTAATRVLFKSVGWGWLGYHAYFAATRLKGFVPDAIGVRNGFLLMEWVDDVAQDPALHQKQETVKVLASYVAARARRLPLSGDCRFENRTYRWTGSDAILRIFRAVYGSYLNRLKIPALRKELAKYLPAMPTLIDGKMHPGEWLSTPSRMLKIDFEHHNFGGAEPDIVDPAYDLAVSIFEFQLSKAEECELVRIYEEQSGDTSTRARLLLYKILYGSIVMDGSMANVTAGRNAVKNNALYLAARDFLIYAMNDFCASLLGPAKPVRWSESLFFMDLDGVFDQELLGFPHATQSGLQALGLLRAHDFSVVLNTGRSVQHVRQYCEAYGLPGGVAEYGAVFVDAVRGMEIPLIDPIGAEQLAQCREAIRQLPGVFIDPRYEYAIRAYRCTPRGPGAVDDATLRDLLKRSGFNNLTIITRGSDSYIVQKRTGKGTALRFVRNEVGSASSPVTAIGDSRYDIGMLKSAEFAYAPSNCCALVREVVRRGQCRVMRQGFQNGLLAAVQHRLRREGGRSGTAPIPLPGGSDQLNNLMQTMLRAADRRMILQILVVLSWWSL
jgi:hydroxymethylpyrimidine pyrophosphatase-like HAD family hydrolase